MNRGKPRLKRSKSLAVRRRTWRSGTIRTRIDGDFLAVTSRSATGPSAALKAAGSSIERRRPPKLQGHPQRALNEQAISCRLSDLGGRSHRHRGVCHSAISLMLARKSTAAKSPPKARRAPEPLFCFSAFVGLVATGLVSLSQQVERVPRFLHKLDPFRERGSLSS
jgi:hypothetical protein